ncbi:hypothetical protein Dimus_030118 [Dionaea muscipula]
MAKLFAKDRKLPKYYDLINALTLEDHQITTTPHPRGMDMESLLRMIGKGGGHIEESFQVLLGSASDLGSGAGTSSVQKENKKRAPRKTKEDVPTKEAFGEEEEIPKEGATQESQTVALNDWRRKEEEETFEKKFEDVKSGDGMKNDVETGGWCRLTCQTDEESSQSDMEKDVDDLITSVKKRPFISEGVIPLETLVDEQAKEDLSGMLYISLRSDGGMCAMLGQDKMTKPETTEMARDEEVVTQREGKEALLCGNVVETSLLTGHAMRRVIKMDVTQKKNFKKIPRLKKEKKHLEQVLTIVKGDFETSISVSNNLSETLKNVETDVKMVT